MQRDQVPPSVPPTTSRRSFVVRTRSVVLLTTSFLGWVVFFIVPILNEPLVWLHCDK